MTELLEYEKEIQRVSPDLLVVYKAMMSLLKLSDNGSIEIHFCKRKIKTQNGVYIKPGIDFRQDFDQTTSS